MTIRLLTQQTIAEHLDMAQSSAGELLHRLNIDWRASTLDEVRVRYIRHLREVAAGRAGSGELDLVTERARLAKAQRERIDLSNAVTRRELAPVILLEQVLAKAGSKVAGILDGIPGMIKRRVSTLTASDLSMIAAEIARARNIAAAIRLSDLEDDPPYTEEAETYRRLEDDACD